MEKEENPEEEGNLKPLTNQLTPKVMGTWEEAEVEEPEEASQEATEVKIKEAMELVGEAQP